MGVSSTRVGDHRGSARTVQFLINLFYDNPHSEVRAFRRIPYSCPHLTSTLAKSLTPAQAQSLTVAVFDPFRPLFSCPFRAGSGLPFLWVRFPHSPCTFSSPLPLPLHPISSSHLHVRISRSRSTSPSIFILSHLQRALYTTLPCFSLSISLPLICIYLVLLLIVYVHTVTSRTTPLCLFRTIYKSLCIPHTWSP